MKLAIYSIPLLGLSLVGCGDAERVDDPIVAKFDATIYDGQTVPIEDTYTDPNTNVTCSASYFASLEVNDGLRALFSVSLDIECDDGSIDIEYAEAEIGDVAVIESGVQYTITLGSAEFPTTLTCAMDAAKALQCTDEDGGIFAFQLAN